MRRDYRGAPTTHGPTSDAGWGCGSPEGLKSGNQQPHARFLCHGSPVERYRPEPDRMCGSASSIIRQRLQRPWLMIQYPQKLAHAVNLVVVPAVREYGEFGLEGGKPGRILRQIDHARLDLCQLMS